MRMSFTSVEAQVGDVRSQGTLNLPKMRASIAFVAACSAVALHTGVDALTINTTTLWSVADASPPAIKSAVKDLSRDWYMAMGVPPNILYGQVPEAWNGQTVLMFEVSRDLPAETFMIRANSTMSMANFTSVTVQGADPIGLAYGIYYISETFLQVDPWWWFIDAPSKKIDSFEIADDFLFQKIPRVFQRAGFFLNDEEIAAQTRSDGSGDSVFDTVYVDRVCETLLRLGGNMIIVESFGLVDESSFLTVENRGITLAQHHVTPMGLNVYAWPYGLPYSYRLNPRLFHFAWRALAEYQVQLRPNRQVAFSVGMRGLWDSSFWEYDPYVKTDQQKGALITWAAGNQTDFLHEVSQAAGRPDPKIVSYTWMELLQLKEEGYLKLPDGVAAIWADQGYGFIRGWQNASEGDGLYTHAMMLNGNANQISEMVPPRRAFQQLSQMRSRNATSYAIINTSDNLPAMMGIEAYMRYLWDAGASLQQGSRSQSTSWQEMQDEYISKWVSRYFPADQSIAADVAALYDQYYNISWLASENEGDHHTGDDGLAATLQKVVAELGGWANDPSTTVPIDHAKAAIAGITPTMPLLESMQLQQVPSIEKRLYEYTYGSPSGAEPDTTAWRMWRAHASLQPAVQYGLAKSILLASNATLIANATGDRETVKTVLRSSMSTLDDLLETMRMAGGLTGPLRGFFQYDQFTFVSSRRQLLYHTIKQIDGSHAMEPAGGSLGNPDINIYGFECPHNSPFGCNAFPFHHYNSSVAWDAVVRAYCTDDAPDGALSAASEGSVLRQTAGSMGQQRAQAMSGSFETVGHTLQSGECKTTWTGGVYKGSSTTVKMFVTRPGATIFYTSNGKDPAPGEPDTTQYTAGSDVTVAGQVTLTYQAFVKNEAGVWTGLAVPVITFWDNGSP